MLSADLTIPRDAFTIQLKVSASAGEITAIFGASGSGKSSLLRAIAGLEKQASGQVSLADEVWQSSTFMLPTHQRDLGFVFQDARLFPHLNVRHNIEFGRKRQKNPKSPPLSLEQVIDLLTLAPLLNRDIATLSGGEKQRVAIARAIATTPSLLLFDEPLAAVDGVHKQEILHYIHAIKTTLNIPILYVSHAIDEVAKLSDKLILLKQGQVIHQGNTLDLLSHIDQAFLPYDETASLIEAQFSHHNDQYGLSYFDFDGGTICLTQHSAIVDSPVRLRILAKDISLATRLPEQTSILNILPADIEHIQPENAAHVLVSLRLGHTRLLSRITQMSLSELKLQPGKRVYCQLKAVSLIS